MILQKDFNGILRYYVGRETHLYFVEELTEHFKNPNGEVAHVYLKREDLS